MADPRRLSAHAGNKEYHFLNLACSLLLTIKLNLPRASIHLHSDVHMFLQLNCKTEVGYNVQFRIALIFEGFLVWLG